MHTEKLKHFLDKNSIINQILCCIDFEEEIDVIKVIIDKVKSQIKKSLQENNFNDFILLDAKDKYKQLPDFPIDCSAEELDLFELLPLNYQELKETGYEFSRISLFIYYESNLEDELIHITHSELDVTEGVYKVF